MAQHAPAEYSVSIVSFAENATVTQLRRTLSRYSYPDAGEQPSEPHEQAKADASQLSMTTRDGRFELHLSTTSVDAR